MTNDKGEPWASVYGLDIDGTYLGPLRMWLFEEEDITASQTYILRGMRVVVETSPVQMANVQSSVLRGPLRRMSRT